MTGGKGYYYLGRGTEVGILCLQSVVFGWLLGDPRIREPGVYKLQDGGKVPQLSTSNFSFRMGGGGLHIMCIWEWWHP